MQPLRRLVLRVPKQVRKRQAVLPRRPPLVENTADGQPSQVALPQPQACPDLKLVGIPPREPQPV